ncbi:MAG: hypothetical protein VYA53_01740 [Acidobacteriota bacterium]|nr:hypothetical protein [Acidobacteriota bacterium]
MNDQILQVLDQSLKLSLWAFIASFVTCLAFIIFRLKARRDTLERYKKREFDEVYEREMTDTEAENQPHRPLHLFNQLPMVMRAIGFSFLLATVCFLIVGFTPFSPWVNFSNLAVDESTPLRLTFLNYERFHDGFSLQGEVWNQSQTPIEGVQAIVQIWKSEQELLEQFPVIVEPDPLPAEAPGSFVFRYTKSSPFRYGYQVIFQSSKGIEIPHAKGFDVE